VYLVAPKDWDGRDHYRCGTMTATWSRAGLSDHLCQRLKRLSLGYALSITILLVIGWLLLRIKQRRTAIRMRALGRFRDAIRIMRALDEREAGLTPSHHNHYPTTARHCDVTRLRARYL